MGNSGATKGDDSTEQKPSEANMFANKEQLNHLLEDTTFRRAFVADYVQEILAAQIRAIREQQRLTQGELGQAAGGMSQVQVSRLENPDYSGASVNSLKRLAQAFDTGLIVRFAPLSEFVDWVVNQTPEALVPPSYNEERERALALDAAAVEISYDKPEAVNRHSATTDAFAVDIPHFYAQTLKPAEEFLSTKDVWDILGATNEPSERDNEKGVRQYALAA